jgi:hypothetical protein
LEAALDLRDRGGQRIGVILLAHRDVFEIQG